MPSVVRWKRPCGPTSAATCCGSACASDTTMPLLASFIALCTFSGVIRLVVPLLSWPIGAHLPHVLKSFLHWSYCCRSVAVSGGGGPAGACGGAGACAANATSDKPMHTATIWRRFMQSLLANVEAEILQWRRGVAPQCPFRRRG